MGILGYLIAGIAFLGALAGLYGKVHHDGYAEGVQEITAKWQAADKAAAEREAKRMADADMTAKTSAGLLAAAQQKADSAEAKWNLERKRHANNTLAGCAPAPVANSTDKPGPPTLRFSAAFLRDWNAGWTGDSGEPIYPDSPPAASYPDDALTSVGPGEVLDQQHADARACSTYARDLNSLIDQITALKAGWK